MSVITRFAPSPTGYLHLGHAYSLLLNFQRAQEAGGRFILRIEDIDQTRVRAPFYDAIYEDLTWLGITWKTPVLIQSEHMARYEQALEGLRARGLVYRCFKSRKDIEEAMSAPHAAPGQAFTSEALPAAEEEEKLSKGEAFAWRLSMHAALAQLGNASLTYQEETAEGVVERKANPAVFGDVVLGRKESGTSYHLASVLDDALQGVTHVIRGEELRDAASLHVLLQALLGLPTPIYRHHAMLVNDAGERLSKRDGALALRVMREAERSVESVIAEAFTRAM
jgi:glutamyl-Q tRNA(Asp) synthetase